MDGSSSVAELEIELERRMELMGEQTLRMVRIAEDARAEVAARLDVARQRLRQLEREAEASGEVRRQVGAVVLAGLEALAMEERQVRSAIEQLRRAAGEEVERVQTEALEESAFRRAFGPEGSVGSDRSAMPRLHGVTR